MAEFAKEIAMIDKFKCEQIVHFSGASTITNHVMFLTEFALRVVGGLHQEAARAARKGSK